MPRRTVPFLDEAPGATANRGKKAHDDAPFSTDPHVLGAYSQDLWPRKLLELRQDGPKAPVVDIVAWPRSAKEVSQWVKWAQKADAILIPYGAGSGVCGATVPTPARAEASRPRLVVDLKKMRAIREIDHNR